MKPHWDVLHGNDLVFTTHSTKAAPGETRSGEGRHSPLTINSSLYSITSSKTEACFVGQETVPVFWSQPPGPPVQDQPG